MLYTDFAYPDEIRGLIRFIPAPAGEPRGLDVVEGQWRSYLERKSNEYKNRPQQGL
jgi:hypothetical protein